MVQKLDSMSPTLQNLGLTTRGHDDSSYSTGKREQVQRGPWKNRDQWKGCHFVYCLVTECLRGEGMFELSFFNYWKSVDEKLVITGQVKERETDHKRWTREDSFDWDLVSEGPHRGSAPYFLGRCFSHSSSHIHRYLDTLTQIGISYRTGINWLPVLYGHVYKENDLRENLFKTFGHKS